MFQTCSKRSKCSMFQKKGVLLKYGTLEDYKKNLERGMWGIIEIMDCLSKAIFKKHLRKQILDLKPDV